QRVVHPRIKSHAEWRNGFFAFERYLLESVLPFVPPPADASAHPDILWKRLLERPTRGILIFGAGGVGKTRTALEIAEKAEAEGWETLHIFPGKQPLDAMDLEQMLDPTAARSLLIFDYIDQMQDVDLGRFQNLVRRRASAERPLHLLANSRPLWASTI